MISRIVSLLLCLLLVFSLLPAPAQADIQELTARCRTPDEPGGVSCTLLISGDQLYITPRTAASLTGYELVNSMSGSAQFRLGSLRVSHTGAHLNASGQSWFPLEDIMNTLNTRVVASGGELIFNPVSDALVRLNEALESRDCMVIAVDPEDGVTKFGLGLAKAFDIFSDWSIADLFDSSYERDIYRSAIFALLQRSIDPGETTFSDLSIEYEESIVDPLSDMFTLGDIIFSEEVMQTFYGDSSLGFLYDCIDAYDTVAGSTDMIGLIQMAEQVNFYGSAVNSGETGLRYLLETTQLTDEEKLLLETIRQSLGVYHGLTDESLHFLGDFYWEMGTNAGHAILQDALLGKAGSFVVQGARKGIEAVMPGVAAMDELEMCAAFYRIQQLADRQIDQALKEKDYLRLKYALTIYYRCAYLATTEIEKMNIKGMDSHLPPQQKTLCELESALLSLSDDSVSQLNCKNDRIYPNALLGPAASYLDFYNSLIAQYGTLSLKNYFGTEYIEEGCGVIAPWIHYVDADTILIVLRQEYSELIQMVYLDKGNRGLPALIDERVVLTCGSNGSIYYGFGDAAGPLLSCVSYDLDLTSYSCVGSRIETHVHPANSSAGSISAMRSSAWKTLYQQFGEFQTAFHVDGSDGLFSMSHSPDELRSIFLEKFNHP